MPDEPTSRHPAVIAAWNRSREAYQDWQKALDDAYEAEQLFQNENNYWQVVEGIVEDYDGFKDAVVQAAKNFAVDKSEYYCGVLISAVHDLRMFERANANVLPLST